jgi:hypothetical protein
MDEEVLEQAPRLSRENPATHRCSVAKQESQSSNPANRDRPPGVKIAAEADAQARVRVGLRLFTLRAHSLRASAAPAPVMESVRPSRHINVPRASHIKVDLSNHQDVTIESDVMPTPTETILIRRSFVGHRAHPTPALLTPSRNPEPAVANPTPHVRVPARSSPAQAGPQTRAPP